MPTLVHCDLGSGPINFLIRRVALRFTLPNSWSTGMSDAFWLTEQQFARLAPSLPPLK